MRMVRSMMLATAAMVLAVSTAAAQEELGTGGGGPAIVSQSANVTVFGDGTRLVQAASYSSCPDGWVCLWGAQNYTGNMVQFQDRGVWTNLGNYGFNENAESWRNRTNDDARVAAGTGGAGDMRCLGQNNSGSTFGTFNDQASSIRVYTVNNIC